MDIKIFESDQHLVHGDISIADSLAAPAPYGTYSIRLPYPEKLSAEKLAAIKIILWSCMDRRVIRSLYDELLKTYQPGQILVISLGGGPIQVGEKAIDRVATLKEAFSWLSPKLPNLQKIWAVAHTGGCGGLKYFCGGKPIGEMAKPEFKDQANQKNINQEVYLTDLLLENGLSMVPMQWIEKVTFEIAQPDEANKTVKIHRHQVSSAETKKLEEVITVS